MAATPIPRYPSVAPVKNVPTKVVTAPKPSNPPNYGWGSATNANDMSAYGYDVPGTAANPSAPTYLQPDNSYSTQPTVTQAATPGRWIQQDYSQFLPTDWEVKDAEALGTKQQGSAEAAFQEALRQAFIDYGGDAAKLGDYSKYIDQATIEKAQQNKFSATAQNLKQMTRAIKTQRALLAGRGGSMSGENTNLTRRALEARELGDYTAERGFLGGARSGLQGLTSVAEQIQAAIAAARSRAGARLAEQYQARWEEGTPEQIVAAPPPAAPMAPPPSSVVPPTLPGETPAERALRLRSEELDRLYGLR